MSDIEFVEVWRRIIDLQGRRIPLAVRGAIEIIRVDDAGVLRHTSRGTRSRMSIESLRTTVNALNTRRRMSRAEILTLIGRRESSGVVAILAATGLYAIDREPTLGLRVRDR